MSSEKGALKLVIINGPSGVGKSSLSDEIHKSIPLCLRIEIDEFRRFISGYREYKEESLALANRHALSAIEAHLRSGHSVIVDKSILEVKVIDMMHALGKKYGAHVYEIILTAEKSVIQERADTRGYRAGGLLTPEKVGERWELFQRIIPSRPEAHVVDTSSMSSPDVVAHVRRLID